MPPIPEHIVDQIRDSISIVDLVSRFVNLKKRGRNYFGVCPFHEEKTPSFSVNPEKQIYKCFGCGAGGNSYQFLMQIENLSFVDAVKRLADETGISIPVSAEYKRQESENEKLYKSNQIAERFYQNQLSHAPQAVLDYLKQRGLSEETITHFKIGYAPEKWDGLLKSLQKANYPLSPYQKLGLLLRSEKTGNDYDRFRNRLMFPIHNQSGNVVGFGGRALKDEPNSPKYMNSPESPVYQKSRILYGLYFAKEAIRENSAVLFVEGYMDLIQLYQNGIKHVVATSGTALTEEHARLIRRYSNRVILCYDADNAGINAAARGGEVLFQQSLEPEVLILPTGEDPDSYVKANGKDAFLELLKSADDYLSFRLKVLKRKYDFQKANDRSQAVAEILETLLPIQDNIKIGFYAEKIAEQLDIPVTMLLNEIQKKQKNARKRRAFSAPTPPPLQDEPPPESGADQPPPISANSAMVFTGAWGGEKDVILLLLAYPDKIQEHVFTHLQEDDFLNPEFRALFQLIKSRGSNSEKELLHFVLENTASEGIRSLILHEMETTNRVFQKPALYLQGCIKQIKIARYLAKIDVCKRKLKEMQPQDSNYLPELREMQGAMEMLKQWQNVKPTEE